MSMFATIAAQGSNPITHEEKNFSAYDDYERSRPHPQAVQAHQQQAHQQQAYQQQAHHQAQHQAPQEQQNTKRMVRGQNNSANANKG